MYTPQENSAKPRLIVLFDAEGAGGESYPDIFLRMKNIAHQIYIISLYLYNIYIYIYL